MLSTKLLLMPSPSSNQNKLECLLLNPCLLLLTHIKDLSMSFLELSEPNSTPKISSWGGCPSVYEGYLCHIFKRCGTLTHPSHAQDWTSGA